MYITEEDKEIERSRAEHKHVPAKGGFKDADLDKIKYCKDCDMFYYPKEK